MHSFMTFNKNRLLLRRLLLSLFYLLLSVYPAFPQPLPEQAQKVIGAKGYDALSLKARHRGEVKVIVKVDVPFQALSAVSTEESINQMATISHAQGKVLRQLAGYTVKHSHNFTYVPYIAVTVDEAALNALLAATDVMTVEEDIPLPPLLDLSVPRIGASAMHSLGYDGSGVAIAILDTGVDKNHPFLAGSVISEACYSTNGINIVSLCPGGVTQSTAAGSAMPYGGPCPATECDHGTHVAGIAAGGAGVAGSPGPGVAPGASVIAIQVFSRFDSEVDCGSGAAPCVMTFVSDLMKGAERVYALRNTYNIAAVNLSIGIGRYYSYCDNDYASGKAIVDNLRAAGIATVIASGNDGYADSISAPACISSAVSVGATDDADTVAYYSNSASFLTLLAPGSSITSSVPWGGYGIGSGTSMAAPHVTGAWALMKQALPGASVTTIQNALTSTGLSVTDWRNGITKKRINVYEALGLKDIVPPTVTAFSIPATANSLYVPITTFTAMDNVGVTGYLITETAAVPSASAPGWTATAPSVYIFTTSGTKTLYAWAKDAAGNVSSSLSATVAIETARPIVTAFSIPVTARSLMIPITTFTATDNVGVTGYLLTETATKPSSAANGWTASAPSVYIFTTAGTKTLYAWAKDAAGNVSSSLSASITLSPLSWTKITGSTPNAPAAAWNPSANKTQLVVRGMDNRVWSSTFNAAGEFNNDWEMLTGSTPSTPALAWNPVLNRMQIVVQGFDNVVWAATFSASGVFNYDWVRLTGSTPTAPALAWNPNPSEPKMQMTVLGTDGYLYTSTFNALGEFQYNWTKITGGTRVAPAMAWDQSLSRMQLVVQGTDGALWSSTFNTSGAFNYDWERRTGSTPAKPGVVYDSAQSMMIMIVQGYDNAIWTSTFSATGSFNYDWTMITGRSSAAPAVLRNESSGKITVIVRGMEGALWKTEY